MPIDAKLLTLAQRAAEAEGLDAALVCAREMLALVRLESHTHDYAGTLSGGRSSSGHT